MCQSNQWSIDVVAKRLRTLHIYTYILKNIQYIKKFIKNFWLNIMNHIQDK